MDWIKTFLDYIKYEKRFSSHTLVAYQTDLYQYMNFLDAHTKTMQNATHQDIRLWIINELEQGMSPKTVNRKISALKSFYRFLLREKHITINPMKKVIAPKQKKSLPVFLTETEMDNLFDQVEFPDSFEGKRDKAVLELFYATGIRLSELTAIKRKDIDFYQQTLKVLGKRRKERLIPFSKKLLPVLQDYMACYEQAFGAFGQEDSFFVTKGKKSVYAKLIYRVVNKYLNMVSIGQKRSPHVIRHTFATQLLNNGAELSAIKELLGHTSLAATQVYTHTSVEKLKETYKQAHPRA
jgi:integrase/recombinase XerC